MSSPNRARHDSARVDGPDGLRGGRRLRRLVGRRAGAVTARLDGEQWRISGRPEPTHYASVADVAVVVADGSLYALALDDGLRPDAEPAMDRTRPLAWLVLEDTPAHRIGSAGGVDRLVNRVATASAADASVPRPGPSR